MKKQIAMALTAGAGVLALKRRMAPRTHQDLAGKVVLITGSTRGLGFILAGQLLERGCKVVICGRDAETLRRAEDALRATSPELLALQCDVSNEADVERLVASTLERFGRVDILVNNAGVLSVGPSDTMTRADVEAAMNTIFWGAYNATMAILPGMRARGDGQIVNITSIGGKVAVPHLLAYSTAKFATVGLSEGLSAELAPEGISVTTVVPGLMRTGSYANATFKGNNTHEYTWFAVLGNLPVTSSDAPRAANRIVKAIERREKEVFITPLAALAARVHALLPGAVVQLLGVVDRGLPRSSNGRTQPVVGHESETAVTQSFVTTLGRRAIPRFQHMAAPGARQNGSK